MATSPINTKTKRDRLESRREPYWFQLSKGRFIGYRKGLNAGSWVARLGKKASTIGDDGTLEYEDAIEQVIAWCDREERGGNAKYSLTLCVEDYCSHLEIEKTPRTAKETRGRLARHLPEGMLKKDIRKITTVQFEAWRNTMLPEGTDPETMRKAKDSANRCWTMLRASLNLAYMRGIVDSDREWKRVKSFKGVSKARTLFLTDKQVRRLLDTTDGAFHALCKAAVLTGARFGELRMARVKDLGSGTLRLSGKTGQREVFLSTEAEVFFKQQTRGKLPEAALLSSPDGTHWGRCQHSPHMIAAVRTAKLPRETVYYSLRHYHISKAVHAGVSLLAIARNCGTSVKMIEQVYGKFTPENMRQLMDMVELG